MIYTMEHYEESAAYLKGQIGDFVPDAALILGSGLGFMGDTLDDPVYVDYKDIPGFAASTAPGHKGRLAFGGLAGKNVVIMQGRVHYYEGYSYEQASFAVRVLHLLGAKKLVVTNAAGGVNESFRPGDLMLITDHIKFFDESPLRGENLPDFGPRFPDCTYLYTPVLQSLARSAATFLGIDLKEGVYMYFPGPQYETPAEIRAARTLGADAVGMSTVPEVLTAGHAGMEVLGVSLISNAAAGVLDKPLSEHEVLESAERSKVLFSSFITACIKAM